MNRFRKSYADSDVLKGINRRAYNAATREYPFFIGSLVSLFGYIVKAGAFSLRVLLRKKIGKRSFGIWSIFLSYLWVRYFMIREPALNHLSKDFEIFGIVDVQNDTFDVYFSLDSWDEFLRPFYILISYFGQMISNFFELWDIAFVTSPPTHTSTLVFLYSYIVVILGLIQFAKNSKKTINWEKTNSFARGESVFFNWLNGAEIKGRKVSETIILMVIEPVFILILGYMFCAFPKGESFGLFLQISAFALFIEEYREYLFRQEDVQDMIDSEYEGERLELALNRFNGQELSSIHTNGDRYINGATIARVMTDREIEKYKEANKTDKETENRTSQSTAIA